MEAVGKNLLLTFEGGLTLRSHLRMRGRWQVREVGEARARPGRPWLLLRGERHEAVLWNGPVLELGARALERLGPDIMSDPPELGTMLARLRATDQEREVGEALLDQRLVSGIGNVWRAEALFLAGVSPWRRLGDLRDDELERTLAVASETMRAGRSRRLVYRRGRLPCRRCGAQIAARRQGEEARAVYWCPNCQGGTSSLRA